MKDYGKELILDLHDCDESKFNRKDLRRFFEELCEVIDMEACKLVWWDDVGVSKAERQTEPHLKGTSAVQFIKTSSIVIHTLDIMKRVYLNIFSCKNFKAGVAKSFCKKWFSGKVVNAVTIRRV